MRKKIIPLLMIFVAVLVSGCDKSSDNATSDDALSLLETEVYYTQKMLLPDGAELEVRLEDVSKMDVASELISSTTREIKNTPPYALQVTFPTKRIKANRRYNLRASIRLEDKLIFTSTSHINPFEVGIASPIKIKVDQVGVE
ncbi:lipoprotein [Psychromonas marina]|uniref:Lipoprotein n=1 Tax=Psychromonas marina TaxID=88364 RepID=A0ABQ6E4X5_9GAMM|nr:YbaY family lipoprotein [Psychromonas marina]GLS92263.1 lipoprotein [Psychromonas marina]